MKRYLIFGALGPFIGGFLLLFANTFESGYWTETSWTEVGRFFGFFVKSLQYSYLFGVVFALMLGAVDDILSHVPRIHPRLRIIIMGALGFAVSQLMYGSIGANNGPGQFLLFGLVGCVPSALSSWLAHKYADEPARAVHST
jgi:hypothetical protein